MRTLKLTLEYDGTRYSGWQEQANARTIAGELNKAAEDFFGRQVEIGGAGRTDAGVHAIAQVAHVKFQRWGASPAALRERITKLRPQEIIWGLNDRLPTDINILAADDAPPSFHARHDATARSYFYQISTRRTAFGKKQVWWIKDRLDDKAMAEAAKLIVGRHDFSAFSESDTKREDQSPIVVVSEAEILVEDHLILFRITASHFLWKMVRRLVGSLAEVGRGNAGVEDFRQLIENPASQPKLSLAKLDPARATAPPSGLFLESVAYPEGGNFTYQPELARKVRVKLSLKDTVAEIKKMPKLKPLKDPVTEIRKKPKLKPLQDTVVEIRKKPKLKPLS